MATHGGADGFTTLIKTLQGEKGRKIWRIRNVEIERKIVTYESNCYYSRDKYNAAKKKNSVNHLKIY